MFRRLAVLFAAVLLAVPASAKVLPYPASFTARMIATNGTSLYVRVGGHGPAVVLLHGFGDSGDMWQPLAIQLVKDHTVIVPDLRGMGLSAHPDAGYTKKNEALDIAGVMDALKIAKADLVTHDHRQHGRLCAGGAIPRAHHQMGGDRRAAAGAGQLAAQLSNPKTWHFNFYGPDEERLVQGRERIFLDRFYNELSADPRGIDEQTRQHYAALYARPHAMHDAMEQFKAFHQDGIDNQAMLAAGGKLPMPVLALGGEKS